MSIRDLIFYLDRTRFFFFGLCCRASPDEGHDLSQDIAALGDIAELGDIAALGDIDTPESMESLRKASLLSPSISSNKNLLVMLFRLFSITDDIFLGLNVFFFDQSENAKCGIFKTHCV